MNAKRKADRSHPDFPEYKRKFDELWEAQTIEVKRVVEQAGPPSGLDGPEVAVHKKYAKKITDLQKEYSHIFIEEDS